MVSAARGEPDGKQSGGLFLACERHMARTPALQQALSNAEPGHKQSSGLFVPGEGSGLWPDAACKAG
jgi:hypothetical protein